MWKPILAALLAIIGSAAPAQPPSSHPPELVSPFHRGVNVLGYDPYWQDESRRRFQWRHFTEIRKGGFDFVRLNLAAFRHMDAQNRLDPAWLTKLDDVLKHAEQARLGVLVDEHDFDQCSEDAAMCRAKLGAFWSQVAPRYANAPRNVAFEILNEPHAKLDARAWNSLFAEMLALVRRSNPTRIVVVGPTNWNGYRELPTLQLPPDPNLLVTFHYYEPMRFTHQGAPWVESTKPLSGISWGSEADRAELRAAFDQVAAWSAANHRPVLLGEFGAYDKSGTPMPLRVAYTSAVRCEAERHHFGWAYWQFDSDFIVWNMATNAWVEPIRNALIPPAGGSGCRA